MADVLRKEIDDLGIAIRSVRKAVAAPTAGEGKRSDLKMIEQACSVL